MPDLSQARCWDLTTLTGSTVESQRMTAVATFDVNKRSLILGCGGAAIACFPAFFVSMVIKMAAPTVNAQMIAFLIVCPLGAALAVWFGGVKDNTARWRKSKQTLDAKRAVGHFFIGPNKVPAVRNEFGYIMTTTVPVERRGDIEAIFYAGD